MPASEAQKDGLAGTKKDSAKERLVEAHCTACHRSSKTSVIAESGVEVIFTD